MHITSLAYFPVLVKVLHNELPWKCPKLDGLSTLFCIIVGNMTLYHTINTLCISTDYLVTRWQRLLVHNSGYFHKTHLFKVTNDPPVLFLHYRKRYSSPLESESATRTQIVEVPWYEKILRKYPQGKYTTGRLEPKSFEQQTCRNGTWVDHITSCYLITNSF